MQKLLFINKIVLFQVMEKLTKMLRVSVQHIVYQQLVVSIILKWRSLVKAEMVTWELACLPMEWMWTGCQAGTNTPMGITEMMGIVSVLLEQDNLMGPRSPQEM